MIKEKFDTQGTPTSTLVRFNGKNYYVSYADLLNKANDNLFAYEDSALTKNAKLNGENLILSKKEIENDLKKSIKMPTRMPSNLATENKQEKKMTSEDKLRKYIREVVLEYLTESDPYGRPDEDKYLFKTGQDYLAGIEGEPIGEAEGEQPSAEELEAKKQAAEKKARQQAYQQFFSKALAKFGYSSPSSIPDEKKQEFYNYIDQNWTSKQEESIKETSATGGVDGYETPGAFTGQKGISKKQKRIAQQLGYELVDKSYAVKDQGDVQDLKESFEPLNTREMLERLQDSKNEQVAIVARRILGATDYDRQIKQELKFAGHFMSAVLQGNYELALKRADGANYKALTEGRKKVNIVEGIDTLYMKDESLTPEQKLGLAMRHVRNNLYEVEKVIQKTIRMKNEENIDSTKVGKRTYQALKRINEKVIRLMVALNDLK